MARSTSGGPQVRLRCSSTRLFSTCFRPAGAGWVLVYAAALHASRPGRCRSGPRPRRRVPRPGAR
eukprot:4031967-Alexandrium_andersonii.AAC.1